MNRSYTSAFVNKVMEFKHTSLRYDYSCNKLSSVLKIGEGYESMNSIGLIVMCLFGTSDLTDPQKLTVKFKGVRKPVTDIKYIESDQDVAYNSKNEPDGYWIQDPDTKASWVLGEWIDRFNKTYAKAKVTFEKDHAIVDLYYTDVFVFQDILDYEVIREHSTLLSLAPDGKCMDVPFYIEGNSAPKPLVTLHSEAYFAAQRFLGTPFAPAPKCFPQLMFVHENMCYSVPYIKPIKQAK